MFFCAMSMVSRQSSRTLAGSTTSTLRVVTSAVSTGTAGVVSSSFVQATMPAVRTAINVYPIIFFIFIYIVLKLSLR